MAWKTVVWALVALAATACAPEARHALPGQSGEASSAGVVDTAVAPETEEVR